MPFDEYELARRANGVLVVLAGGVALGIWAWWSRSQSELARDIRTADGGWWWIVGGIVLFVTLVLSLFAP